MAFSIENRESTTNKESMIKDQRSSNDFEFPGGHRGRVTPVPIPNTEVKPATADGTACAGVWESRSLPGINYKAQACALGPFRLYGYSHPQWLSAAA